MSHRGSMMGRVLGIYYLSIIGQHFILMENIIGDQDDV